MYKTEKSGGKICSLIRGLGQEEMVGSRYARSASGNRRASRVDELLIEMVHSVAFAHSPELRHVVAHVLNGLHLLA